MRPKFVFALILLAVLVSGAIFLLKQHSSTAKPETARPPATTMSVAPPVPAPSSAPVAVKTLTPEERQAAIDAETDLLQQLSMKDDPASLSAILADLTHSEKEVREAAIEAAKQFGSSNAIPALKAVAANTTDTGEQIALLEAADFLSLPSINFNKPSTPKTPEQIQAAAERRAQAEARRQARLQKHADSPNPQPTSDQNPPPAPNN